MNSIIYPSSPFLFNIFTSAKEEVYVFAFVFVSLSVTPLVSRII